MPVPVVESNQITQQASGTSMALTEPSGLVADDVAIIIMVSDANNPSLPVHTAPTGETFTAIDEGGDTTSDSVVSAWYRVWTGSEGTVTVNYNVDGECIAWMIRVSGCDTSDVLNGSSTPGSDNSASHAVGGFNTDQDDTLAFYCISGDGGDMTPYSVSGTGWSEGAEGAEGGAAGVSGSWGTKDMASQGATGTATVSTNASFADGAAWFQFALNGAAAGGSNTTIEVPTGPWR